MLFSELKKHLRTEDIKSAYYVTGEDAFLIQSALKLFRALAEPVPDFNLGEMVAPQSAVAIAEACESLPLGGDRRVVIVTEFAKTDMTALHKYLDNPCPSTVLVFCSEKPENNMSKLMSKLAIVDCSKLDRRTVLSWIAVRSREYGSSITESAAQMLIDYCAGDMSRVAAELGKLCSYRLDGVISEDDVASLTAPTLDFKIFALSEAVAARDSKKAAVVLKSLTESGASPVMLIGMLYSHFRRLLYTAITPQYDRMPADLGVKEFAVRKAKEQAGKFTPKKLKKICDGLQETDFDIKSGRITDKVALELTVLRALAM